MSPRLAVLTAIFGALVSVTNIASASAFCGTIRATGNALSDEDALKAANSIGLAEVRRLNQQYGANNVKYQTAKSNCKGANRSTCVITQDYCVTAKAARDGEEGGKVRGCPPGTVPVPETDNCVAARPKNSGSGTPVDGRSYGGVLRSAPSMGSARVASLSEGQAITIVRNTGQMMNGYAWFEIRAGGTTGYHWGGIFCSYASMPGVFRVCE